jgi:hypothetical protein
MKTNIKNKVLVFQLSYRIISVEENTGVRWVVILLMEMFEFVKSKVRNGFRVPTAVCECIFIVII